MDEPRFTLHQVEGYIATLYLLEYPDKVLLLDGGARRDAARIKNFFDQVLKRPLSDLKLMLVSHLHPDHAGGASLLRRRFSLPIAAHYEIDRWYRGASGAVQHIVDMVLGHYSAHQQFGKLERAWYPRYLKPDYLLHDEEFLPLFSDWQAFWAPGHTLYDMVFYQPQEELLYLGDLIIRVGDKIVLLFPTLFPELMAESLRHMAELPLRKLLLAHGGVVEIEDAHSFFTGLLPQVGRCDYRSFRMIEPICSLAPDVRIQRKIRANQD